MRRCPDKLIIEVDLAQAEWVVTAYYSRDANMLKVIEEGLDPHAHTGHLISGAPHDFIQMEDKLVGHSTDPTVIAEARKKLPTHWQGKKIIGSGWFFPRTYSIRQAGKKSNHGLNYNMKHKRFALENEMEERDAGIIVTGYHAAYTGLARMYSIVEEQLKENRTLTNCFGQMRRFLNRWDQTLLDAAYAFIPQSTVARVTLIGLQRIYDDVKSLQRVEPLLQVHDSIVNQAWPRSWHELAGMILLITAYLNIPLEYHGVEFTLRRDIKIGPSYGELREVDLDGDLVANLQRAWFGEAT